MTCQRIIVAGVHFDPSKVFTTPSTTRVEGFFVALPSQAYTAIWSPVVKALPSALTLVSAPSVASTVISAPIGASSLPQPASESSAAAVRAKYFFVLFIFLL